MQRITLFLVSWRATFESKLLLWSFSNWRDSSGRSWHRLEPSSSSNDNVIHVCGYFRVAKCLKLIVCRSRWLDIELELACAFLSQIQLLVWRLAYLYPRHRSLITFIVVHMHSRLVKLVQSTIRHIELVLHCCGICLSDNRGWRKTFLSVWLLIALRGHCLSTEIFERDLVERYKIWGAT